MYTHEKIVYRIFGIHKYLPLYMYRYTDKVTKIYTYNIHKSNKLVIG